MSTIRPMLDDLELQQVQQIEIDGDQVLVQHSIPTLEGDFFQRLGRRATQVTLTGVLTGPTAGDNLDSLRRKFRAAAPVAFTADIATATRIEQVLIEEMGVRELAGKPARFEYAFTLREYVPATEARRTTPPPPLPPPPPVPPQVETGTLIVEVIVEGQPEFDHASTSVAVSGVQENAAALNRTLSNRTANNVWTDENLAPSLTSYTVTAATAGSPPLTGSAPATVRAGQTTQVQIRLAATPNIAKRFVVHFRFDKAFVEPCMRSVLRQVIDYASTHANEKLLIVGHTDKTGSDAYNQSLSERRARSIYAFLTFGVDAPSRAKSIAEWHVLREPRPAGELPSIKDNWGVREYQHMLQDLGFYAGNVDGQDGPLTQDAVQAYRCQNGLAPGITVDPPMWEELITDYLAQDQFGLLPARFLPNCENEVLKWLGCGEQDPVKNVQTAWRPNRRTELLFVTTNRLPCQVPEPATFRLPTLGAVNQAWCLGPGDPAKRGCFVVPATQKSCAASADPNAPWCRQPVEPGTMTVTGSIQREQPDGTLQPAPNQKFILTAPDGEFKAGELSSGEPQAARTDANGGFTFPDLPVGFYTLEVLAPVLARLNPPTAAPIRGNAVCARLTTSNSQLNVVIPNGPALREIRLPVVAHLMTARNATGVLHATTRDANNVRQLFEQANRIWQQARIHFALQDVVRASYEPLPPQQPQVTETEFFFLLAQCAYPNVLNIFFVEEIQGTRVSFAVSFESGSQTPGCALEDMDNDQQAAEFLAHTLGLYLNLEALTDGPGGASTVDRLMHGGLVRTNTRLVAEEITRARAAGGAQQECVMLTMTVSGGAVQIGGTQSPNHLVLRADAGAPVTVEAQVPPAQLALGTLTITGGDPVAGFPQRRTVSSTTGGRTTVQAEFVMPAVPGGAAARTVRSHVHIIVVDFELVVQTNNDVKRLGAAGSTIFVARQHQLIPPAVVSIEAQLTPASALPTCIPSDLVQWQGGQSFTEDIFGTRSELDAFHRVVSRGQIAETTVRATVAGRTRSVVIRVLHVALDTNQVRIEGIRNAEMRRFNVGDLFSTQPNSLFRARADVPGVVGNTLQARLLSRQPNGATVEAIEVTLTRTGGHRFETQLPLLAIPQLIQRNEIRFQPPQDIEIIRAVAGGSMRLELIPDLAGLAVSEATVRGMVIYIFAQAFAGSGVTVADINRHIARAARVWAQAGIEVKTRSVQDGVAAPPGLLNLDHNSPFNGILTAEERQLVGLDPGGPVRSATATDNNVYYVASINGPAAGVAYSREGFRVIVDPANSAIAIEIPGDVRNADDAILAHELGHQLLRNWGGNEHQDPAGNDWPNDVIMHPSVSVQTDVAQAQVENILLHVRLANSPMITLEP